MIFKWIIRFAFLLVFVLLSVGCGDSGIMDRSNDIEEPIYRITFKIKDESRMKFLGRIQIFAEQNAFAIRKASTRPNSMSVLIQLWREDIKIIGVNPFDKNVYKFTFYSNNGSSIRPKTLKILIDEIKGVTKNLNDVNFEEK